MKKLLSLVLIVLYSLALNAQCIIETKSYWVEFCAQGVQEPISGDGEIITLDVYFVSIATGDTLDYIRYDENDRFLLWNTVGDICDTSDYFDEPIQIETYLNSNDGTASINQGFFRVFLDSLIEIETIIPDTIRDTIFSLYYEVVEDFTDPCLPKITTIFPTPEEKQKIIEREIELPGYNYYIPNVIRPFSNNYENSVLKIYSPDKDLIVEDWKIFDRWGDLQWNLKNVPLHEAYWDGTCRGQMGNKDVYTYWVRIRFSNNVIKFIKGDVTLL